MARRPGVLHEFWLFIKERRNYILAPIILVLLLLIVLVVLGGTSAAPFVYTLF